MKQPLLLLIAFFAVILTLPAQTRAQKDQYTKASDSDPAAKAILTKLRQKYEGYKTMQAEFALEIELSEQPKEVQKGTLARQGDKYRLEIPGMQTIISDGKSLYLILHGNKEVQINNVPEEDEDNSILSPQALFRLYESDQFAYVLANEIAQNGTVVQQIEFKPLDPYADYSKLRMEVDKKKNEVIRVLAFGKDGSRYTFQLTKVVPNPAFPADLFAFNKAKYPGYHVEDLRY